MTVRQLRRLMEELEDGGYGGHKVFVEASAHHGRQHTEIHHSVRGARIETRKRPLCSKVVLSDQDG